MRQGIPIDSVYLGGEHFVRPEGTSFWAFLKSAKIPFHKDHFPFITKHAKPRIKQVFDFDEYIHLNSRGEALGYLYAGLGKALNYVGSVLDLELPHGFNDHTDRHTLWVAQTGVELLQRSGYSFDNLEDHFGAKSEVLMTLVGLTHDLGNFIGRKEHSAYSAWMLTRLFGNTYKHPDMWHAVLYSILFHEEPVLKDLDIDLSGGMPLQWALVAADKMHVGRDRIGPRAFETGIKQGAFEDDIHILLNAMIVRSTWYMSGDNFIWHLGFSVDQLEEKFASLSRDKRLWVPKMFQKLFISNGIKYRDTFIKQFREIYEDRMKMAAQSVFLLYPYINTFEARLGDIDTRGKVGSQEKTIWTLHRPTIRPKASYPSSDSRWWIGG